MSDKATQKGLRDQLGDGYLNLLDSVRHSVEQAAWGQETSGNLGDDFYRWVGDGKDAPQPVDGAELQGGVEVRPAEVRPAEQDAPADRDWKAFEAWIDGKIEAHQERQVEAERGRDGPGLGE